MAIKNWEADTETQTMRKNNIWKIVCLHVAIKCNSMIVFRMKLADFFGETKLERAKKNNLMMDLCSSSLIRICCSSNKNQFQMISRFCFHVRRSFCLWTVASWSWSWSWRSLVNESIITGFYLAHPLPHYPFVCMCNTYAWCDCAKNKVN